MGRGLWTISDQALFAGANFVVNVLLARWLPPEGYGAYTVAYTVFLLLGTFHGGGIVEPMLVFGSGKFEKRLEPYLRILLTWHGRFAIVAGVILGVAGAATLMAGQAVLGNALLALAVGQAAILFQWHMRGACYIRTQPRLAATTGVLYAVLMLGGAALINAAGMLNEATAIGLMAGASLAAGVIMAARLGIPLRRGDDGPLAREAWDAHRRYGGWAASTGALEWFHGFLPFLLLPMWYGLEETGQLRALFNFVLPILHVFHALAMLVLPVLVRARESGTFRHTGTVIGAGMGVLAVGYAGAVLALGPWAMDLLYDGKYNGVADLLWLVALLGPILAVSNVAQALLRSQERPEAVFAARAGASGVAATVGAACVWVFGVAGALLADALAAATESVLMAYKLWRGDADAPEADADRVLVVAFACSPGRGSEPGQGWQLAHRLAAHVPVTLLTYTAFRPAIEAYLHERPIPGLRVVYHRLPLERARHWREGRDREPGTGEQLHYYLWQITARRVVRRLHREAAFALTHHVSFMRCWSPTAAAALHGVPFLWGPVGGGESAPEAFYAAFSRDGLREARLRDRARRLAHNDPWVRQAAGRSTIALATTEQSAAMMRDLGARDVRVARAAVALADGEIARLAALPAPSASGDGAPGAVTFAAVGRLLHWKGYSLALRAFAEAFGASGAALPAAASGRLEVVGDGPERAHLEALAGRLGIADRVTFHGHVPRNVALGLLGEADVMVHPSLHDSGGYATLEAMAAGRPVVCLDLGGPGRQVDAEVGVAVQAVTPEQAVRDIAAAFRRLAADPALRTEMGARGRARVSDEYRWSALVDDVLAHYREIAPPGTPLARRLGAGPLAPEARPADARATPATPEAATA